MHNHKSFGVENGNGCVWASQSQSFHSSVIASVNWLPPHQSISFRSAANFVTSIIIIEKPSLLSVAVTVHYYVQETLKCGYKNILTPVAKSKACAVVLSEPAHRRNRSSSPKLVLHDQRKSSEDTSEHNNKAIAASEVESSLCTTFGRGR